MKTLIITFTLLIPAIARADNCYVLNGFPADQARCVQQAQQQQNIQTQTNQQFQVQQQLDAQAMNAAILLDQLRMNARNNVYIDPNTLPQTIPPSQLQTP